MGIGIADILNAAQSLAAATGKFDGPVGTHEPKNPPGNGLTCAIWFEEFMPATSGLDSTSIRLVFKVRLYAPLLEEPQDGIDINMIDALDAVMAAFTGDFTFGGLARNIDLTGSGIGAVPLSATGGYANHGGMQLRIIDVTLPIIVNDVWEQDA